MDYAALKTELTTDPLTRGYAGMTDQEASDSLNTKNRTRDRVVIPGYEVIEATVASEWSALSAAEKQRYQTLVSASGGVYAKGANTRAAFLAMFGGGTATRTNLAALQTESISRAEEIGWSEMKPGYVAQARAM